MLYDIDKERSALVFIEFQNEWLSDEGILQRRVIKDLDAFRDAVRTGARIIESARSNGWTVVHAGLDLRDDPDYLLFNGGRDVLGLRGAIPRAGTWRDKGVERPAPFAPLRGEFVVAGRSGASVLKNSTLDPFLRNRRIDTLFLMGFATHVCVESSLREAHDMGYNAYLVEDACAAFERAQHEHVRKHVVHHFGAETNGAELIARMEG
ncbi:isochorismatase hydrolase [Pseudodesulfovibrio mercurii]|uniref:Isochorismatase hydrolase n=1 Tax=Pseudodesulfovibrio mercurii TaxID=641491 RepID=F0JJ87_9BACT|nr:cysteine hydrolase family protein [Pseudodesulfovibrio mercurii]EGB15986.1 isochorismatase hydrolase [Pseudodesulfovibrio mercurii]